MPNYFLIIIYTLSIFSIFMVPLYINLQRARVIVLSFLPPLLIATVASVGMMISYLWSTHSLSEILTFSIFIFFELFLGGYILMLPILILVAFIIEYLRIYYHYSPIKLALTGGILATLIVAITFMTWKFIWVAFVNGFVAVLVQYYFTEYKK